jgi:Holliday junction DNA helicase RuvA
MIARINGKILSAKPSEVIIDIQGIGYRIAIPFSTYDRIAGKTEADLHVHTYVREDQIRLFGFSTSEEKDLFDKLIHISGIGPSVALAVLSGIGVDDLKNAIVSGDISALIHIPGIGKSKAEKLIFELARKFKVSSDISIPAGSVAGDAVRALMSLGYDEKSSRKSVDAALRDKPDAALESVIKKALAALSADK